MQFIKKIYKSISKSKKKNLIRELKYLLEEDFVYTYPEFSLEFLEQKTGADQKLINQILLSEYQQSFYQLTRTMRINCLKQAVKNTATDTSLNEYTFICGYSHTDAMLRDLKTETGLDFDEFCRYTRNVNDRVERKI
ncbi:hypothetical protein [Belliella aquatica]|uniref:HTH araC/xylS-type domain-containing protein n=1 Tax=Belliella aquatica TaxID=1323734 RepID=A0ABQ1MC79_9BACT|nr:hypothetical protein [Belliella aquatica]MCH7406358.1 hypothetical protein [Belliella aquatica]GGC38149.1 hypothetical protein GCM10010993_16320 [Belliella aquatica]